MTRTTHTPGPWTVDTCGSGKPHALITSTHDADGIDDDICEVYGGNIDAPCVREANAHLIAAAPDMLDALKELLAYEDDEPAPGTRGAEVYAQARAAIAKAEGRS